MAASLPDSSDKSPIAFKVSQLRQDGLFVSLFHELPVEVSRFLTSSPAYRHCSRGLPSHNLMLTANRIKMSSANIFGLSDNDIKIALCALKVMLVDGGKV